MIARSYCDETLPKPMERTIDRIVKFNATRATARNDFHTSDKCYTISEKQKQRSVLYKNTVTNLCFPPASISSDTEIHLIPVVIYKLSALRASGYKFSKEKN